MTIHDFDMARYLAGDIVEVQAMGANLIDPGHPGDRRHRRRDDHRCARPAAPWSTSTTAAAAPTATTSGSRRSARRACCRPHNRRPTTVAAWGAERTEASDPVLNFFIERYREAYDAEIDHFVDCFEQGARPLAGFAEGREALRLADAALESARTGRVVRLDGEREKR